MCACDLGTEAGREADPFGHERARHGHVGEDDYGLGSGRFRSTIGHETHGFAGLALH